MPPPSMKTLCCALPISSMMSDSSRSPTFIRDSLKLSLMSARFWFDCSTNPACITPDCDCAPWPMNASLTPATRLIASRASTSRSYCWRFSSKSRSTLNTPPWRMASASSTMSASGRPISSRKVSSSSSTAPSVRVVRTAPRPHCILAIRALTSSCR